VNGKPCAPTVCSPEIQLVVHLYLVYKLNQDHQQILGALPLAETYRNMLKFRLKTQWFIECTKFENNVG